MACESYPRKARSFAAIIWVIGMITPLTGGAVKRVLAYPSGIHRAKEVSLGVETGIEGIDLNLAGVSGTSAVRATVPVRFGFLGAIAGIGLPGPDGQSFMDLGISVGGLLPKGPWQSDAASAATSSAVLGGLLVRGTLWSTRVFEAGLFARVRYIPALTYKETFVVGNLGLPGEVESKHLFLAESGIGMTFWLRAGSSVFVVPYAKAFLSPVVVTRVSVRQDGLAPIELSNVTSGLDRLIGLGAGLGFALPRVIITPEVRGLPWSGAVTVQFPFGGHGEVSGEF